MISKLSINKTFIFTACLLTLLNFNNVMASGLYIALDGGIDLLDEYSISNSNIKIQDSAATSTNKIIIAPSYDLSNMSLKSDKTIKGISANLHVGYKDEGAMAFEIEAGYTATKYAKFSSGNGSAIDNVKSIDRNINNLVSYGVTVNSIVDFHTKDSKIAPYVKGGIGIEHVSTNFANTEIVGPSNDSIAPSANSGKVVASAHLVNSDCKTTGGNITCTSHSFSELINHDDFAEKFTPVFQLGGGLSIIMGSNLKIYGEYMYKSSVRDHIRLEAKRNSDRTLDIKFKQHSGAIGLSLFV